MAIIPQTSHTESQGIQSQQFVIKANAKAFRVLTENLYSYKEQSVVREICANAYDSHICAGKPDIPIKVTMPSIIYPNFEVEDHGVGLSREEAVHLFSTVFESTKETSNENVGSYGLGSKSPFAIADSFSIMCVKDGFTTVLMVFKGDDGLPQISDVAHYYSGAENGVKVSIPIEDSKIRFFNEQARISLFPLYPKPTVNVEIDSLFDPELCVVDHPDFMLINVSKVKCYDVRRLLCRGHFVLNGPAMYNLDASCHVQYYLASPLEVQSDYSFVLKTDIGSVDIPPNRESLDWTIRTKQQLELKQHALKTFADSQLTQLADYSGTTAIGHAIEIMYGCHLNTIYGLSTRNMDKRHLLSLVLDSSPAFYKRLKHDVFQLYHKVLNRLGYRLPRRFNPTVNGMTSIVGHLPSNIVVFDVPKIPVKSAARTESRWAEIIKTNFPDIQKHEDRTFVQSPRPLIYHSFENKSIKNEYTKYIQKRVNSAQKTIDRLVGKNYINVLCHSYFASAKAKPVRAKQAYKQTPEMKITVRTGFNMKNVAILNLEKDTPETLKRYGKTIYWAEKEFFDKYQYVLSEIFKIIGGSPVFVVQNKRHAKAINMFNIPHVTEGIRQVWDQRYDKTYVFRRVFDEYGCDFDHQLDVRYFSVDDDTPVSSVFMEATHRQRFCPQINVDINVKALNLVTHSLIQKCLPDMLGIPKDDFPSYEITSETVAFLPLDDGSEVSITGSKLLVLSKKVNTLEHIRDVCEMIEDEGIVQSIQSIKAIGRSVISDIDQQLMRGV